MAMRYAIVVMEKPTLHDCRMGLVDQYGNVANSTRGKNSTSCAEEKDTYISFNTTRAVYYYFSAQLNELHPPKPIPPYIHSWEFGISSAQITLRHYFTNGRETH